MTKINNVEKKEKGKITSKIIENRENNTEINEKNRRKIRIQKNKKNNSKTRTKGMEEKCKKKKSLIEKRSPAALSKGSSTAIKDRLSPAKNPTL